MPSRIAAAVSFQEVTRKIHFATVLRKMLHLEVESPCLTRAARLSSIMPSSDVESRAECHCCLPIVQDSAAACVCFLMRASFRLQEMLQISAESEIEFLVESLVMLVISFCCAQLDFRHKWIVGLPFLQSVEH